MNCRDSKVAIALHLGHDEADPSDWEQARRHAATCDDCRQHYKRLKKSMSVLEQADDEATYEVQESLWPQLESRLSSMPGQKREHKPRSWTPFVSFTIACMLFLMVWANPPQERHPGNLQNQNSKGMSAPFTELFHPHPRDADSEKHRESPKPVREENL
ncbi:anti-sigma factor [Thalassoglobus polymorphus]|uniref:Zinc-finger domain-containing protein n=1 Tax=Thalassoglobus polymorphus TaxID=2527994 RepID=A0A517QLX8_9PLAN|nr:hypothetical protein [Thalassoglobus polymorphus]QDT32642.1 hypothetical protein Mal48_18890 [Thalassoglobus polymorphus]